VQSVLAQAAMKPSQLRISFESTADWVRRA
jgi:hypothetical protein